MIDLIRFGKLVKIARRGRVPRISQTQLAGMVGVTQSFISDLENGRLRLGPRDPEVLDKISEFLDISLEDAGPESTPLDPVRIPLDPARIQHDTTHPLDPSQTRLDPGRIPHDPTKPQELSRTRIDSTHPLDSAHSLDSEQLFRYLPLSPHPTRFRDRLRAGKKVLTMEIHPPKGVGLKRFQREAMELKEWADAVNVTDNQRALLKLSSTASARVLLELGMEPICQIACRDRNRLGLQSEILSGYVLGIRNFFIIMGDPPEIGDHPDAQPVFDLHSVQMLEVAGKLRSGFDMSGRKLNKAPRDVYLGSACNPFAPDSAVEYSKLKAKVRAGAEFLQTQPVYDTVGFRDFLRKAKPLGVSIIAGYIPILDRKTLDLIDSIPGIALPQKIRHKLETTDDIAREGAEIARHTIPELYEMSDGVHLMNIGRVKPSVAVLSEIADRIGR